MRTIVPTRAGSPAIRVAIADDESLFRTSLRHLLSVPPATLNSVYGAQLEASFDVVGESASGEETIRVIEAAHPDLLLLDLCMPRMSGLDVLRELTPHRGSMRIILLTGSITDQSVLSAVRLGVHGLVVKHAPTELLFEAIASVLAGRYWLDRAIVSDLLEFTRPLLDSSSDLRLTAREREVLALVAGGLSNRDIARRFALSEETVKHHLTHLYAKIGASNRHELALLASRRGTEHGA
jgi:DNA-binding NarL/FixJ family response regulator